jgi:uncharacterized membrane protein
MYILLFGLIVFFAIHLLPASVSLRQQALHRLGEYGYKGVFALIALLGLALVVYGMSESESMVIWQPPAWAPHLALAFMLPAAILLVAAYMPTNLKRFIRHPMLWGVTIWATVHLLANGDLGSMILFCSFLVYSLFDMWSANRRGASKGNETKPLRYDAGVVVTGTAVYVLLYYLHPYFFGVPVI